MNEGAPVSSLAGCGRVTTRKLNNASIYTIRDLLLHEEHLPGVDLGKLKAIARKECYQLPITNTQEIVQIKAHSWYGHVAHVLRSRGQITRAIIGDVLVFPHRVLLSMTWRENRTLRRKSVSPIAVFCTQQLWLTRDIVSDDSGSEDETCEPLRLCLPRLEIHIPEGRGSCSDAVRSIVNEVNTFYDTLRTMNPDNSINSLQ